MSARKELADLLVEEGLYDGETVQATRRRARREGIPLVAAVVQEGRVGETDLADLLARRLAVARVDLSAEFIEGDALREVSHDVAERRSLLPLSIDRAGGRRVIRVAMADPLDAEAIEEIESSTVCRVEGVVASLSEIAEAVHQHYRGVTTKLIPRGRPVRPARTGEERATQPHHRIEDEAPVETRLRALLSLLVEKGVLSEEDYVEAIKRILKSESSV